MSRLQYLIDSGILEKEDLKEKLSKCGTLHHEEIVSLLKEAIDDATLEELIPLACIVLGFRFKYAGTLGSASHAMYSATNDLSPYTASKYISRIRTPEKWANRIRELSKKADTVKLGIYIPLAKKKRNTLKNNKKY